MILIYLGDLHITILPFSHFVDSCEQRKLYIPLAIVDRGGRGYVSIIYQPRSGI